MHPAFRLTRWHVAGGLLTIFLLTSLSFFTLASSLKDDAEDVRPGMSQADVEAILGPPYLTLNSSTTGQVGTMVWINQLWQVTVDLDENAKVSRVTVTPSDSRFRSVQSLVQGQ